LREAEVEDGFRGDVDLLPPGDHGACESGSGSGSRSNSCPDSASGYCSDHGAGARPASGRQQIPFAVPSTYSV
jgi:hypothetical protein